MRDIFYNTNDVGSKIGKPNSMKVNLLNGIGLVIISKRLRNMEKNLV
tara:strand:+ start:295 stop:435 length:141 start_codon:yes stop_codon:yes gene_type:complete